MVLFPYQTQDTQAQAEIPWNIQQVNAPSFWQHTKGDGVVVAVVDTGLDVSHPEFAGRTVPGRNFTADSAADVEGHGTHVAGIIAGATCGVAPGVRIMPLKVFGKADGFQFQDAFRFIREYNKTAAPGDKVVAVNCSWGGPYDAQLHYMIRELVSDGVGVIVSAGNAGDGDPETAEIFSWPGFLWEPITVGALNQDGQPAGYSSSYDGIDLGAPGTLIYSAWPGGGYKLLSGTSMAAPHVTGAYALLVAAFKQRERRLPTGDEIEKILFKHIKPTGVDERLSGVGILDLTYETKRWPLYRVQTGAFFNEAGAIATKEKLVAAGFSAYPVKY
jgi:major intracellular serine protease